MPTDSRRRADDESTGLTAEQRASAASRAVEQVALTLAQRRARQCE